MSEEGYERRSCVRFKIPGATVDYQRKTILPLPGYIEEFCPLLDISRGGPEAAQGRVRGFGENIDPRGKDPLHNEGDRQVVVLDRSQVL